MKQGLLSDIELDVHELKYLMESFSKEPTPTLVELLKRSIARMQSRLDQLQQEVDTTSVEEPVIEEAVAKELTTIAHQEARPIVLGESLKLSSGLRQSISLNDSFRFVDGLFGGDVNLMNRVIEQISVMSSYKTAVAFLSSKIEINEEKEAAVDFLALLKKHFSRTAQQ